MYTNVRTLRPPGTFHARTFPQGYDYLDVKKLGDLSHNLKLISLASF